ncbi:MAG: putative bifunctional diguanylate cyclase/phosphodiesterase, partial [Hyphomicrobiales bacterium]
MDWNSSVLSPYRLRTVRVGVQLTLVTLLVLLLYRFMPGRGPVNERAFDALLGSAGIGTLVVWRVPWSRLFETRAGIWGLYSWSVTDIVLITLAIAATGGVDSNLYLLYVLVAVFFAASYPPKGQAALFAFMVVSYVGMLAVRGDEIGFGTLWVRLSVVALSTYVTLFLSRELLTQMLAHHHASAEAQKRSELLAVVAEAAGQMHSLDRDRVLTAVVNAVAAMGLEGACINVIEEGGKVFRPMFARGLPAEFGPHRTYPVTSGMTALVLREKRTVIVHDYSSQEIAVPDLRAMGLKVTIATPVWRQGELAGLLVGASLDERELSVQEVEAFELLAAQAGHALETAALAQGLQEREARFRSLVQNASDVVCVASAEGRLEFVSPAVTRHMGYPVEEALGASIFEAIHEEDVEELRAAFDELVRTPGRTLQAEVRLRHADGSWRWVEGTFTNLLDLPSVAGVVINFRDTTERKAFEKQLGHQAYHDSLTGLPNRAKILRLIGEALNEPGPGAPVPAVSLLDLDGFKTVNDSLGHELGDQLIMAVADRLRSGLRPGDTLARLGGDEFIVLMQNVADAADAMLRARELSASLEGGIELGTQIVTQTASIGIAIGGEDARGANDLLRRADLAMYAAKERGKACCVLFDAEMARRAQERLRLEADLRRAVEWQELSLLYQPIVSLRDRRVTGVEALVRWNHPRRGILHPSEFIAVAEETGLVVQIGRWVLWESCRQARLWEEQDGHVSMGVNVSARQFDQPDFVDEVAEALEATGLEPGRLHLEITESVLIGDAAGAMDTLQRLRQLGVRLAIDDFGTGYSSLSYLRRYPLDILKVDKSFIEAIDTEDESLALAHTIICLAHTLNMTTVAEG